jgi:hypothetical protein
MMSCVVDVDDGETAGSIDLAADRHTVDLVRQNSETDDLRSSKRAREKYHRWSSVLHFPKSVDSLSLATENAHTVV